MQEERPAFPMCINLRAKQMYYAGPEDEPKFNPSFTCWYCVWTQKPYGPDYDLVNNKTCTPSRQCYEAPEKEANA